MDCDFCLDMDIGGCEQWDDSLWADNSLADHWLDEPSRVMVSGCSLERIREYYHYWLGNRIARIAMLMPGMPRMEVVRILFPTGDALHGLLNEKIAPLPMCLDSGIALMKLIQGVLPTDPNLYGQEIGWKLPEHAINQIREAAKVFDTSLSLQFDHLDTYRVMPKGTHDTRKLIEQPEIAFDSLWINVVDLAQKDWVSCSRCLAFDLPTACGFHSIRAMEAQVLGYLKLKAVLPKKRDLGHYVDLLKQEQVASEAVSLVEYLRIHHRNPLMHPEDTLEVAEAMAIFDLTKSAIIYLIVDAKSKGLIT